MSQVYEDDYPADDDVENEQTEEYNECHCDECGHTFFLPSDADPDCCPSCGAAFGC